MSNAPPDSLPGSILSRAVPRAGRTIRMLLQLMLPISLGVALLRWTGALESIGRVFAPVMSVFRLPGESAVALFSGYLGGIYALIGAMTVLPLTPAQLTILSSIALVSHNLIVECTVQDKAGTPWWWMLLVRLTGGILVGIVVAWSLFGLESIHVPALWLRLAPASHRAASLDAAPFSVFFRGWARDALVTSVKVALIVTAMMLFTEWIRSSGVLGRLERGCRPALRFFGLKDPVAYPWLTAQILGVAFGAGLLIEEFREKRGYDPREVRDLHTSIGLSHSLLEDTILLVGLGASLFWIIVPRMFFAAVIVRLVAPLPVALPPAGQGDQA